MQINPHINKSSTPSFGWNIKTHGYLTKCAIDRLCELKKYENYIRIGAQMPDISIKQTSAFGNMAHFFFGKNFVNYAISPQNASDFYFDNIGKAIEMFNDGCSRTGMYHAGNALHFLQDMTVPIHTKPECYSIFKLPFHIKYENIAKNNPEMIDKVASSTQNLSKDSFYQIFIDAYDKSSKMDNPYKLAGSVWENSVRQSLDNAYVSTLKFLNRLADYFKASPHQRKTIFFEDEKKFFEIAENINKKNYSR